MGYEIIGRTVVYRGSPMVTITSMGRLAFNKGATLIFQKEAVENVLLLWDKEKRFIGIRPIVKKDSRSYKLHWNKRGDGAGFSAAVFLKIIEYNASETRSFFARWDEQQQIFEIEIPEKYFIKGGFIATSKARKRGNNTQQSIKDVLQE